MFDELLAEMAWHSAYMRPTKQYCMNAKALTDEQVALLCMPLRTLLPCLYPLIASSMPITFMAAAEQLMPHVLDMS